MGYIITIVLGVVVLSLLFAMVVGRGRGRAVGQVPPRGHDITPKQPAAEEPTPPRSAIASDRVAQHAVEKTPPA